MSALGRLGQALESLNKTEPKKCGTELATRLSKILAAMDAERNNALILKHSIQAQAPSP